MKKIIHIHAKCNLFEIHEQLPEGKVVQRLKRIRRMFLYRDIPTKGRSSRIFRDNAGQLIVKTRLVNPELF